MSTFNPANPTFRRASGLPPSMQAPARPPGPSIGSGRVLPPVGRAPPPPGLSAPPPGVSPQQKVPSPSVVQPMPSGSVRPPPAVFGANNEPPPIGPPPAFQIEQSPPPVVGPPPVTSDDAYGHQVDQTPPPIVGPPPMMSTPPVMSPPVGPPPATDDVYGQQKDQTPPPVGPPPAFVRAIISDQTSHTKSSSLTNVRFGARQPLPTSASTSSLSSSNPTPSAVCHPRINRSSSPCENTNPQTDAASPFHQMYGECGISFVDAPPVVEGRPKTFPDLICLNMLRTALNLQIVLINAIESIDNDFYKVLIDSAIGHTYEKELQSSFKGIIQFLDSARRFAVVLKENMEQKQNVLLTSILSTEKWYLLMLGQSMGSLYDGYVKLRALRGVAEFSTLLANCVCSKNQNYSLDDVMLTVASYPQHLLQLCKTQLTYRPAFERAHAAMLAAAQFCEPMFSDVPLVPKFAECDIPPNDTLNPLGELVLKSTELASLIGGVTIVRQIRVPPKKAAPEALTNGQHRKLIDIVPGYIRRVQPFGLTYNVSASLIIFTDGAVLCRNVGDDCYQKYEFVEFYWKETCWYHIESDQKTFTICNRIACPDEKLLPPGWEETSNARKKEHFYVYKPGNIKQEQNPMSVGCFRNRQVFMVESAQTAVQASQKLRELTNDAEMPECKQPPHTIIGVDLTTLTEFDKLWMPDLDMPELFKILIPYFMTTGISEKGIFRVAAEKRILDDLCLRIQTEELSKIDMSTYSINTLSGLMKMFLRDMPNPLLPLDMYVDFMSVAEMTVVEDRNQRLIDLIGLLPKCNREALSALMNVLFQIHLNNHMNAMDDKNLGIVTAPNILRNNSRAEMAEMTAANTVVASMIENYETIFEDSVLGQEVREAAIASKEWVLFKRKLIGNVGGVRVMIADPDKHTVLSFDSHSDCVLFDADKCRYMKAAMLSQKLPMRIPPSGAVYHQGKFWVTFMNTLLVLDSESLEIVHQASVPAQSIVLADDSEVWIAGEGSITIISTVDYSVVEQMPAGVQSIISMISVGGEIWAACKDAKKSRVDIHQWDRKTRTHVSMFRTDMKDVFSMASFQDKTVWIASDNPGVCVWDIATKDCIARITSHPVAFSLCMLPDQVWFGSRDDIVIIDPRTYKCVGELRGYHANSVFSTIPVTHQDRVEVWSGSFDKSVCVWSVSNLPNL